MEMTEHHLCQIMPDSCEETPLCHYDVPLMLMANVQSQSPCVNVTWNKRMKIE